MENQQMGELVSEKFTWTIESFSNLKTQKLYSEVFLVGDWKWRLLIFPKGNNVKQLSVYLEVVDASDLTFLWTRLAQFSLTVVNQLNSDMSITKDSQHEFNASESDWGFTSFMPLSELYDCNEGFLWNDKCIIEAEVSIRKVDFKILEDQGTGSSAPLEPSEKEDQRKEPSRVDSVPVPHSSVQLTIPSSEHVLAVQDSPSPKQALTNVDPVKVSHSKAAPILSPILSRFGQVLAFQDAPSSEQILIEPTNRQVDTSVVKRHEEVPSAPIGKLVEFRGLGRIEKAFVPLLEEVCSWHPSLVECQKKRSRTFIEWAFTALGRVLHFLKTKKVKDMTEDACEHLQLLWEELETFKFDLVWLVPSVHYALNVKKLVERAGQVKKQREDVDALEIEVKRQRARLAVAELDLEVARRDLAKAEEGICPTDMNRELGYGRH